MPDDVMAAARRVEMTIHKINSHWWNRRIRPEAQDLRTILDVLTETQALRAEIARAREAVSLVGEIAQHGGVGGVSDHWAAAAKRIRGDAE